MPRPQNHPGWNCKSIGDDLYLNPWWGMEIPAHPNAKELCRLMTQKLGPPDYWDQGCTPRLLWGRRDLSLYQRPSLSCNMNGHDGKIYVAMWLPWRGIADYIGGPLVGAHCQSYKVDLITDQHGLVHYAYNFGHSDDECSRQECQGKFTGRALVPTIETFLGRSYTLRNPQFTIDEAMNTEWSAESKKEK